MERCQNTFGTPELSQIPPPPSPHLQWAGDSFRCVPCLHPWAAGTLQVTQKCQYQLSPCTFHIISRLPQWKKWATNFPELSTAILKLLLKHLFYIYKKLAHYSEIYEMFMAIYSYLRCSESQSPSYCCEFYFWTPFACKVRTEIECSQLLLLWRRSNSNSHDLVQRKFTDSLQES